MSEEKRTPQIDIAEIRAMNKSSAVNRSKKMDDDELLADLRATRQDSKCQAEEDFEIGKALHLA